MAFTLGAEALDESVTDRVLDEESGARETHLTAVVEHHRGLRGGGVEVGVLEDDEGPLATQLGGERREIPRGRLANDPSGLGRTGEGDPSHARIVHERPARFLAQTLDEVEDARRESGLVDQVHE